MPCYSPILPLFLIGILYVASSVSYSDCHYALNISNDGPATLDVPVTVSAQLECADDKAEYLYEFEDDIHKTYRVLDHAEASASFIYSDHPAVRTVQVTAYLFSHPLFLVATGKTSFRIEDYIPGTLNFTGIVQDKNERKFLQTGSVTNISVQIHYPRLVLQESEFAYSWTIEEDHFTTDQSYKLHTFTDVGPHLIRVAVVGRIPFYPDKNGYRYKWGYFGDEITIKADFQKKTIFSRSLLYKTTSGCFHPRSNHWEKLEEARSVTSVAAEFGIAHSIVSRLWRQFQTTGTAIRGFSSGRPRGITPADDRYIVLQARRNRRQTAGEIARHTTQATGRPISRFTVARRLHGGGLFARRPVRCVPLTPAHRRRRSLWCREHRNWRDNEWGRVLFTDESRFSLSSDSHRILIWRERGSRNHPSNIIERDRYGGRGVLVWGGIMLGSRTDLHIFDAGSVNGTRYCNEILLPYVRLFRGAMGLQFLFMDDNAPCHRTVAAEQLLESEDIERRDWPARSLDFNPIEHVWDFQGSRLAARTLPPVTIREFRLALQDERATMPQQLIDTLILSMGRRCETCLAVRGDHIPY
ncbi:transposable element Tcb2 transposase [Trichonephila clavipes]|nr:transposable element Tcb2 transposase [Trichonephila clavipes]